MPVSSDQISQMIYAQQMALSGQGAFAQGGPMAASAFGAMSPAAPWAVPMYNAPHAAAPYGENMAMRMASFGSNVVAPTAMAGMSMAAGLGAFGKLGGLFDPFGAALGGARAGWALGGGGALGAGLGMMGAAGAALPGFLAYKAMDVYGSAFTGGMHEQAGVNQMLRSNFRFYGGQGAYGRGFSTGQMGQVGGVMSQFANRDLSTSMSELSSLTAQGAQMGMFSGVRDVQQFSQKFRQMISTLKTIQGELGGTLTEAMQFMRNANSVGVFRNLDQFASQVRTAQGVTGMSQQQIFQTAGQGAQLSMMMGGRGAQGARGAVRMATSLGSARDLGVINDEALSDATGATGAEGLAALTGQLMQHTARFSRRAMGRYSIFGLSNAAGTGLDSGMVNQMLSGGLSISELSRSAHRNVGRMGRARAINNEGLLRGSLLEEGGLAGQISIMRAAIGDRVLDQGDDMASLWMQRRMGMSRPQAEIMMSLMRNQSTIAQREVETRAGSRQETRMREELQSHRSLDAFTAHLTQSMQEAAGIPEVKDMGRKFMTRMTQVTERVMNHLLGIAESTMTAGDRSAVNRMKLGIATEADAMRIQRMGATAATERATQAYDPSGRGLLETGMSVGEGFKARGVRVLDQRGTEEAFRRMNLARAGRVTGVDAESLERLTGGGSAAADRAIAAAIGAGGANGDYSRIYGALRRQGITGNAADAYIARNGLTGIEGGPREESMLGRIGAATGLSELFSSTRQERAAEWIAGGGHLRRNLQNSLEGIRLTDRDAARLAAQGGGQIQGGSLMRLLNEGGMRAGQKITRVMMGGREVSTGEVARTRDALSAQQGLSEENVNTVLQSEDFRGLMDRINAAGGNQNAMMREIEAARRSALQNRGATSREQLAMLSQMEDSIRRTGRVDRAMMVGSAADRRAYEEAKMSARQRATFLENVGGGHMQWLANRYNAVGTGESNDWSGLQAAESEMQRGLAHLSGRDYNNAMASITERANATGATEETRDMARALQQQVGFMRGRYQRLSGEGRGGRRGALREAFSSLTGGLVQDVEVNGRRLGRDQIMSALGRGGAMAEEVRNQLYMQTGGLGMDRSQFDSLITRAAQSGGKMDQTLIRDIERAADSQKAQEARSKAMEAQQRARDPLAAQQVDLLRSISGGISTLVANAAGVQQSVPQTTGTGGMSQ